MLQCRLHLEVMRYFTNFWPFSARLRWLKEKLDQYDQSSFSSFIRLHQTLEPTIPRHPTKPTVCIFDMVNVTFFLWAIPRAVSLNECNIVIDIKLLNAARNRIAHGCVTNSFFAPFWCNICVLRPSVLEPCLLPLNRHLPASFLRLKNNANIMQLTNIVANAVSEFLCRNIWRKKPVTWLITYPRLQHFREREGSCQ